MAVPNSILVMRGLRISLAAGVAVVAMVVSGCGVAAPKNVASVDGVGVSMDDVDTVARDPLSQLVSKDAVEFKLPGDAARNALMFELTRAAWVAEAKRWGLDLESVRSEAEKDLQSQLDASSEPIELSDHMREAYVESTAARLLLDERFAKLDPDNEADLRKIYEMSPALWDRTCAWILTVPDGTESEVQKLADSGMRFDNIAKRVDGTTLAAQPNDGCLSRTSIPVDLREGISQLALGKAKIFETDFGGTPVKYLIKVISRSQLTFAESKQDLTQIVTALQQSGPSAWISTRVAEAQVDPRFASAVTLGSSGEPTLVAPLGPIQPSSNQPQVQVDGSGL